MSLRAFCPGRLPVRQGFFQDPPLIAAASLMPGARAVLKLTRPFFMNSRPSRKTAHHFQKPLLANLIGTPKASLASLGQYSSSKSSSHVTALTPNLQYLAHFEPPVTDAYYLKYHSFHSVWTRIITSWMAATSIGGAYPISGEPASTFSLYVKYMA